MCFTVISRKFSKSHIVLNCSKTGIVVSNPARGMNVCTLASFCIVMSCLGEGLAMVKFPFKESYKNT
jgi:hypothetical protein